MNYHSKPRRWGANKPCYLIAEVGINHNGDIDAACDMIWAASLFGADAVKFQKRTIDAVYSKEELEKPRESRWGTTTRDQKEGLEFSLEDFVTLSEVCYEANIDWGVSPWDVQSAHEMLSLRPNFIKIASPSLTNKDLLKVCGEAQKAKGQEVIMSTGMSSSFQVEKAFRLLCPEYTSLLHCVSAYPPEVESINMKRMQALKHLYGVPVGYSGHETGNTISCLAVSLGACILERHFTVDKNSYGSDQKMSLEPHEFADMVEKVRDIEAAIGTADIVVQECEKPAMNKLRKP